MKTPLLTIIIINNEDKINQDQIYGCIESCKNIDLNEEKYEILLIGNLDNNLKIKGIIQSERIKIIKSKDRKIIDILKLGLKNTSGKYLLVLFSEDRISERNNIGKLIKIMEKNKKISHSISSFYFINNENKIVLEKLINKSDHILDSDNFLEQISINPWMSGPIETYLFKIQKNKNYNFYNMKTEFWFCTQFILSSKKLYYTTNPNVLVYSNRFKYSDTLVNIIKELIKISYIARKKIRKPINDEYRANLATKILFSFLNEIIKIKNYRGKSISSLKDINNIMKNSMKSKLIFLKMILNKIFNSRSIKIK
ncbi:MAG: hypothetical protein QXE90_00785 [Candidatus Micrarchaeia archaeon]